jgi:hypothetical protein
LLKTNVNERFSQQEVIIIIKLYLSIIFNGFPVLSFPVCIVQIFRSPEKRWIEVSLYLTFSSKIYNPTFAAAYLSQEEVNAVPASRTPGRR